MIKEIKIENFKSVQSLNLELGRLNVFIGANGSGKSNILEGIAFGSVASSGKLSNEFLSTRGIRVVDSNLMISGFNSEKYLDHKSHFSVNFTNLEGNTLAYLIMVNLQDKNKSFYLAMTNELIDIYKGNKFQALVYPAKASLEYAAIMNNMQHLVENQQNFINDSFDNFLIYAPENNFLRNFNDETQILPLGIRGEGLFKEIVEIAERKPEYFEKINKHLQFLEWFEGFEIPNDLKLTEHRIKIKDKFLQEGLQYIDQRSANEGFLYLLFYLTLFISDDTPKFFAIDNIDNAMNPKLGSELIRILSKLAKEHGKQVILTTHNPSILDGLDLSDDEQRLFVISRNKSGHTQAIRVPHRESDERLSTRFIRGSIGGLPKNF